MQCHIGSQEAENEVNAESLLSAVEGKVLNISSIDVEDASILYYVSGYLARSISKGIQCLGCIDLLISSRESPKIPDKISEEKLEGMSLVEQNSKDTFFKLVDRGGLFKPPDLLYVITFLAFQMLQNIFSCQEARSLLISFNDPVSVFTKAFVHKINNQQDVLIDVSCKEGHKFSSKIPAVARKTFNISSKNFVNEQNSKVHAEKKGQIPQALVLPKEK